ncbi:YlbG family protein [Gracilibacillus marinus]|jgi:uncharacterized protein YlbG (UPF0298 family)|uniref:YlbG family protein n=1 Tax=Gracilibacillus marinus TaxID=630535 RepID=A0ABV8VW82_9BACI
MLTKRQSIIVWFHNMKNIKQLKKHGHLIHVSKKLKYAIIYVNQDLYDEALQTFNKLPFVTKVEKSYRPFVKTEYENASKDRAKEYDYKMGI